MNSKKYLFLVASILLVVVISILVVLNLSAPETSSIELQNCLANTNGSCLLFPEVTGENLNGDALTFPQAFTGEYNIVIMPFDRDQQTSANEWLAPLAELTQEFPSTKYYSIAALPDLAGGIRFLVVSGMNVAVTDPENRAIAVVLFLEQQETFIQALGINNVETSQILLLDNKGEVLWRDNGLYNEETLETLRTQLLGRS